MELGLGLFARMLTRENLRFAAQAGATAIVVHMADYAGPEAPRHSHFDRDAKGRDVSAQRGRVWTVAELRGIRELVESEGLRLAALENLNPALWYDVLLDGPERGAQLEQVRTIVRNMGAAGIGMLGYNFSLAGVHGPRREAVGRAGAVIETFDASEPALAEPLPAGFVWNRWYDPAANGAGPAAVSQGEQLRRHAAFLAEVLPVAEECGVTLALHPDDPPVERLRGHGRMLNRPELFRELAATHRSRSFAFEFCVGTVAEMPGAEPVALLEELARAGRVGYVHLRNVQGTVPRYREVFLDEGDVSVPAVLAALDAAGFSGTIVPDHTPLMECEAPWHSGMAFALGYLRGAMQALQSVKAQRLEAVS